jgi:hypothetical protein
MPQPSREELLESLREKMPKPFREEASESLREEALETFKPRINPLNRTFDVGTEATC